MDPILCLNAGSSSLKFALFRVVATGEDRVAGGAIEGIGLPNGRAWIERGGERRTREVGPVADLRAAAAEALAWLNELDVPPPAAVGHRLVHGGPDYHRPVRLDRALLADLRRIEAFAPLHLPGEIAVIEAVRAAAPTLPQIGCFDTGFHHDLPDVAQRFALPEELWRAGVRRYGFHGLSYEYVVHALGSEARGRWVIAHLGNGASLAAVRDGRPVDTTMGLTPTGGVVMGTRSGDLDPGVLTFVARRKGWGPERLDRLVNYESGLLGVSGTTSDMRLLLERRSGDGRAARAVDLFCASVRKAIGAFAATLGGLDGLVFTGGIGENAAEVRAEICRGLEFLGVEIDPAANEAQGDVLSVAGRSCRVRRIATDEDRMIARHVACVLAAEESGGGG